jgi:alpha-galactosidase
MAALAQTAHNQSFKFGLSSSAGNKACFGDGAGSLTFEQIDAADFASWGVDYLDYADCNGLGIGAQTRFTAMRDALNKTGRGIFYALTHTEGS